MEGRTEIPENGVVDGETRTDKASGVPWVFREGQFGVFGKGWRRAIPAWSYPVSYNRVTEAYTLITSTDDFVPEPLNRDDTTYDVVPGHISGGKEGSVPNLVDARRD